MPTRRSFRFGPQTIAEDGAPTDRTPDEVAEEILRRLDAALQERSEWMEQRLARYAKMRGWLESKNWPWQEASNQHIPVMMANVLRTEAGLFNAVLGLRPMMTAKPTRHEHVEIAEDSTDLIDYQFFVDNPGEQTAEQIISRFCQDGTTLAFCPYLRTREPVVDVRVVPKPEGVDIRLDLEMANLLPNLLPKEASLTLLDEEGTKWRAEIPALKPEDEPTTLNIRVVDRDARSWDIIMEWDAITFDGPSAIPLALEDVVVPMRCENLQPVSAQNPTGAPWVGVLSRVSLDTVAARIEDGTYDLLTKDDLDDIRATAGGRVPSDTSATQELALKEAKDQAEGRAAQWGEPDDQVTLVTWYGPWDVGRGRQEEVIITVLRGPKKVARVRYLTEQYPGLPPRRPFAEARFIPVPDQFYGVGLPELMEGMHDFLHVIINQMIDNGTLTNLPFGFYRASSGMKPEPIQIPGPGEMLPLDNPGQDVAFPVLPHADQSFGFNMVGLGMQFLDRLVSMGPMQFGQIQQGKASALRTVGTTMAILQQGAAMPEQILRRLFFGFRQIWTHFHLLNVRFLPPGKRFLLSGKPADQKDSYKVIDPSRLNIPLTFDFQATLLNTNKGMVSQALQTLGMALFNPLSIQMGTVNPEGFYHWQRDLVQALQLDPARYVVKPPSLPAANTPRLTAAEVILWIVERMQVPPVAPMEAPEEHLQALIGMAQKPENQTLLGGEGGVLLREYLRALLVIVQQQTRNQAIMQAAQDFGNRMGNEGQGQTGGMGEVPPMQTESPSMDEMMGAGTQGPPGSAG